MGDATSPQARSAQLSALPGGLHSLDDDALSAEAALEGGIEVVRSEERAHLGTEVRVSGRAVLRKYVVTETTTQTFQVRHEEVRLEHEPAAGPGTVPTQPVFDGRVVEVTLHREVPVVQMKIVPTERVRLHVDIITEQVAVSVELRKERLDLRTSGT